MSVQRLHIAIQGVVQGVGFRPFIYRLATELGLGGWVTNSVQGVLIEVEGCRSPLDTFLLRLRQELPPRSHIQMLESVWVEPLGTPTFEIRPSIGNENGRGNNATILPDISTCSDCLQDLFNPTNRRYRYPFTNCTHCGPRFSIIHALPYDRPHTTMHPFTLCSHCQQEYTNPGDRRFHAQPNACSHCGPHLELWNQAGQILFSGDAALTSAATAIREGKIVAVKGLGGFHLMVNACDDTAIQRLRQLKKREAKPFALMYPSLELIKAHCEVSEVEEELLRSPAAPIVLLIRRDSNSEYSVKFSDLRPAVSVAPHNPYLGVMLPYTPFHHLLMHDLGFPVVATSGNLSDEPICIDNHEAIHRLGRIADIFLVHNRAIACPVDDSVVQVQLEQPTVLRRSRGYAPLPIHLKQQATSTRPDGSLELRNPVPIPDVSLLALGAQLKSTIALSTGPQVFLSQHIGDLETVPTLKAFQDAIAHFQTLYELQPTAIACDLHPDYRSTQFAYDLATQLNVPVIPVQHHYAHVLSCMAEHQLDGSVLGIAWDGTGYGFDGTIWGGEFLQVTDTDYQRVAHLLPFRLPGGTQAIREPRRAAIGVLYAVFGDEVFTMEALNPIKTFSVQNRNILKKMLNTTLNTPITSSMGRLFDAIASIIGLRHHTQFEGQAAMDLEFLARLAETNEFYSFKILNSTDAEQPMILDWRALIIELLADMRSDLPIDLLARKFHNTLVEMIVEMVKRVGEPRVVLTGGCFQNQYLTVRSIQRLSAEGFCPYWHQQIPSNDGGIALGQIVAASRVLSRRSIPCV